MACTVSVPATSANLGPGYDSFGLALGLRNEFSAELSSEWSVTIEGEGEGLLAADARNQVVDAMVRLFEEAGRPGLAASVTCKNAVPVGRGLGSSASAIVGGLMLADSLIQADTGQQRIFELAAQLEGHPDNVAAALFGGMTVCWSDGSGPNALCIEPARGLAAVISVSDMPLSTSAARAVLPDVVPHSDAAFNAGRSALLVMGISNGDVTLLREGLADRIHEQYRRGVVRDLDDVRRILVEAGADGAVLSGAGPSVIGLVMAPDDAHALESAQKVAALSREPLGRLGGRSVVYAVAVDRAGAFIR